ncbi:MAG: hypothetical protein U0X92_13285 [Anaerolineales bacterium]
MKGNTRFTKIVSRVGVRSAIENAGGKERRFRLNIPPGIWARPIALALSNFILTL